MLEVAKQAGHSQTMALTNGHVIEELERAKKLPAETVIRQARDKLVRTTFAGRTKRSGSGEEKSLENAGSPLRSRSTGEAAISLDVYREQAHARSRPAQ